MYLFSEKTGFILRFYIVLHDGTILVPDRYLNKLCTQINKLT